MKIEIYMEPVFELALSNDDVVPLLVLSNYHYDSVCRAAGAVGGFICRWRDATCGPGREPMASTTPVVVRTNRRELDTMLKVCEGVTAAVLSRLLTRAQEAQVGQLCALVLTALEHSSKILVKYEPAVIDKPTRRGELLWGTSPGRW